MYLQHMLLKIRKKTFWKFTFSMFMSIVFSSFKHPKLPISIKIPVTLLQIVHICMTANLQIRVHELPLCQPASCVVVKCEVDLVTLACEDEDTCAYSLYGHLKKYHYIRVSIGV